MLVASYLPRIGDPHICHGHHWTAIVRLGTTHSRSRTSPTMNPLVLFHSAMDSTVAVEPTSGIANGFCHTSVDNQANLGSSTNTVAAQSLSQTSQAACRNGSQRLSDSTSGFIHYWRITTLEAEISPLPSYRTIYIQMGEIASYIFR